MTKGSLKVKKKGQATLESIFLLVILVSLSILVIQKTMKEDGWMKEIINAPGNHIRGMSIAGVWKECKDFSSNCNAMDDHPNHRKNTLQVKGESSE